MNVLVISFVVALVVVGYVATAFLGVPLRAEERLAYGGVLGPVWVSVVAFPIGWWAGLDVFTVIVATSIAGGVAWWAWLRTEIDGRAEWADLRRRWVLPVRDRENPLPLAVLTLLGAAVSVRILNLAYSQAPDGGIQVGHLSTFGDWSAHLAYAGSFAYGDNFPPELPTAAGLPFAYHFGVDYFAALFVPLGLTAFGGLQVSTAVLAVAFPAVMYCAALRIVRSRTAAVLATLLFALAGGTLGAWTNFFGDLDAGGLRALTDLPQTYAFDGFRKVFLDNPVLGFLYPQRPTLIGFPLTLMILALLLPLVRGDAGAGDPEGAPRPFGLVSIGVIIGLLPIFHVFAFPVVVGLIVWWAVLDRFDSPAWLMLLIPALAIGVPLLLWEVPEQSTFTSHFGWVTGSRFDNEWDSRLDLGRFWLYNTGIFLPLLAVAMVWRGVVSARIAVAFAPIWALFVVPHLGIFHGWEGNNAKYVAFLVLLGAPFVAKMLVELIRVTRLWVPVVAAIVVFSTLSGGLDLWIAFEGSSGPYPAAYLSGADMLMGEWAREETEPKAVFVAAPDNAHPIRTVGYRRVVAGSLGRLRDLGVDWIGRNNDVGVILRLEPGYEALLNEYRVDYVVIGPAELAIAPGGADAWAALAPTVYEAGGYRVFDVGELRDPGVPRDPR